MPISGIKHYNIICWY